MKVLVACEESQAVTIEFRKLGHEAYSCDIQECSGGHPEWHIKDDIRNVLRHDISSTPEWDMVIAFPPCTHLAVSGAAWFEQKRKDGRQQQGIEFFEFFTMLKTHKVAIENPVGIMSSKYRKPDQIIHPYYFGDGASKATCLWLKNLPPLYHNETENLFDNKTTHSKRDDEWFEWVDKKTGKKKRQQMWYYKTAFLPHKNGERGKARSKTFPGIAKAMAEQWGGNINDATEKFFYSSGHNYE